MRVLLITGLLVMGLYCVNADLQAESEKPEVTKLEVVDLAEGGSDAEAKDSEVQRKRDSGYSYKRPDRFTLATRARFQVGQSGHKGRIVNRHPGQINRPVTKYGPPGYTSSPLTKPAHHNQQHRDKFQQHGHYDQQHSDNFDGRPNALAQQEVPSPIRHYEFVEPNPIASQNNEPFASNAANYLPPQNQKLPGYVASQLFSQDHVRQNAQGNGQDQSTNFQSQDLVQSQEQQISDAALFLSQNAQAIQQLYAAPAIDQDFAPSGEQFPGDANQVQNPNVQFQNFETSSPSSQGYSGAIPSYASGTLTAQETLEQIQSLEKDRLIEQLQRALATQTQAQNVEAAGRYAQNQASFVQNQQLLASLGQQMKIHGLNAQQNTVNFGAGGTALNQSPFLPGTTIRPQGFPLSYGITTTTQTPAVTTPTSTTTGVTTVQPHRGTTTVTGQGTTQLDSNLPTPSRPSSPVTPPTQGFPVYGGFVPTLITGGSFVPAYGTNFFAPGTVTSVQSSGSSPTHFGLPIPTDHGQKPSSGSSPSTPSATPSNTPSAGRPNGPLPASPLHPVGTPLHPVAAPVLPVTPLHPLPGNPTHAHPGQTPQTVATVHPTYGVQTPIINPSFLYKPVKPIYPLYYYPNVAYQLQKPALPTYPWSYAPSYAQTKPAQIWK